MVTSEDLLSFSLTNFKQIDHEYRQTVLTIVKIVLASENKVVSEGFGSSLIDDILSITSRTSSDVSEDVLKMLDFCGVTSFQQTVSK